MPNPDTLLMRERLLAQLDRVRPGDVAIVHGPFGSGRETLLRQWVDSRRHKVVWCLSSAALDPDRRSHELPDVVVVTTNLPDPPALVTECRRMWPRARLVVMSGVGWSAQLSSLDISPEVAISGRDLRFTQSEITDLAKVSGVALDEHQCADLLQSTAGYALFVSAAVGLAAQHGHQSEAILAAACDRALVDMTAAISAIRMPWHVWESLLLVGRAPSLTPRGSELLWEHVTEFPAAIRTLREAEVLVPQGRTDAVGFPRPVREAIARRLESDVPPERQRALVRRAVEALTAEGLIADAVSIGDGPAFRSILMEVLSDHWLDLVDVPADQVRSMFAGVPPADASDRMVLALVRSIIDISQLGHPVRVTDGDRNYAHHLLDGLESATTGDDEDLEAALAAVRAIELRVSGRDAAAIESLDRRLDRPLGYHVTAIIHLQRGLTLLHLGESADSAQAFAEARLNARAAGAARLADIAADFEDLALLVSDDVTMWWRHVKRSSRRRTTDTPAADTVEVLRAVRTLDIPALRRSVSEVASIPPEDPLGLFFLALEVRNAAHQILQTPRMALQELDLFETALRRDALTDQDRLTLALVRAELLVDLGRAKEALAVLDAAGPHPFPISDELTRARVLVALGQYEHVVEWLPAALEPVAGDRGRFAATVQFLLSVAHQRLGNREESDSHLESAIALGAHSADKLPFLRLGLATMTSVLDQARQLTLDAASSAFVVELWQIHDAIRLTGSTIELTERERVILVAMTSEPSVRHLATRLHVSPNTVKSQLRGLYRKLGTSSWDDTVRTARLLGLLPTDAASDNDHGAAG